MLCMYAIMYVIYYIYIYVMLCYVICYSEEKNNHIFRKIFRHFAFINYIILYDKTYAKIRYKSYNNCKCHHWNKINNLPTKKLLTYLLNRNKLTEKNIRYNDSSEAAIKIITLNNKHTKNI